MDQENETTTQISIEDLKAVLRLIDVVSKRGAIQPIEMTGVGCLYEKITKYLLQNSNQDKSLEM